MKNKNFVPPLRHEIEVIPSWSGARRKRQFLRRMDTAYWNIQRLGDIVEEP